MTITAKIIADSISQQDIRLTTLQLRYPKWIHGEFLTHRTFSRNASSSRAIPVGRLIQDVIDDTAMPVKWFKNRPGMQGTEEVSAEERNALEWDWKDARDAAVRSARCMNERGVHKQHINRVIEPFCHVNVVCTATDFANFFALRDHPDAQPEIHELAVRMKEAMAASEPVRLRPGKWHLPYADTYTEINALGTTQGIERAKVSVARCARVSYLTHEGKEPDVAADMRLYEQLVGAVPLHASPAEHQATPDDIISIKDPAPLRSNSIVWANPHQHGNLRGWRQYRKMLPGECMAEAA
jgi:hypothetical protein